MGGVWELPSSELPTCQWLLSQISWILLGGPFLKRGNPDQQHGMAVGELIRSHRLLRYPFCTSLIPKEAPEKAQVRLSGIEGSYLRMIEGMMLIVKRPTGHRTPETGRAVGDPCAC